jgi:hypothetical protein
MVYTSDLRIKNLLKDLHVSILKELKAHKLEDQLYLRIFDNVTEDNLLWEDGGLTFKDPETGLPLGSNDGAWYTRDEDKEVPLVVVEGTYGTERGQFGDGQMNRFSHPLAVAKLGYIGVLLTPYAGESYVKDKGSGECNTEYACMKYAYVRKMIVKSALEVSKAGPGLYLVIDAYEPEALKRLVIEAAKSRMKIGNSFDKMLGEIMLKMKNYAGKYDPEDRSLQFVSRVFDKDGQEMADTIGRIYTHNYEALTTATKRDGHGLLGKTLAQSQLSPGKTIYSIFIRLTKEDMERLSGRHSKEFTYVLHAPSSHAICLDDLIFLDKDLEKRLRAILRQNLHKDPEKGLIARTRHALENNIVRIDRKGNPTAGQARQLSLDDITS